MDSCLAILLWMKETFCLHASIRTAPELSLHLSTKVCDAFLGKQPRVAHSVIWHFSCASQIYIHPDWKITKCVWASILHIFHKMSQHKNCFKLNVTTLDLLTFAERTFWGENSRFPSKPIVVLSGDLSEVQPFSLVFLRSFSAFFGVVPVGISFLFSVESIAANCTTKLQTSVNASAYWTVARTILESFPSHRNGKWQYMVQFIMSRVKEKTNFGAYFKHKIKLPYL